MKRLILAGLLLGLTVTGLCLAGVWSGQGMAMTYSDEDPNDGGVDGPERMMGMAIQPVWLTEDPNDPNEPIEGDE
jgi:hypothetical protein